MIVRIKAVHPDAHVPKYAKPGDACVDLVAVEKWIDDWDNTCYNTGLAIEIPNGHVGLLYPRSSVSKTDMLMRNSVGVIDSGYRGPLIVKFKEDGNSVFNYKIGDRVCQLMIIPYPVVDFVEVEQLSETSRGSGGFGSTGA